MQEELYGFTIGIQRVDAVDFAVTCVASAIAATIDIVAPCAGIGSLVGVGEHIELTATATAYAEYDLSAGQDLYLGLIVRGHGCLASAEDMPVEAEVVGIDGVDGGIIALFL